MDDTVDATQALVPPASLLFDGNLYDINGATAIGWEVADDYGNIVERRAWIDGEDWVDPSLAPVSGFPSLLEKARAARALHLKKAFATMKADLPPIEEETPQEALIPVPQKVRGLWEELGLVLTEKKAPVTNVDNVVRILEGLPGFQGRIWLDEFTRNIMTNFSCKGAGDEREWTDEDTRQLWLEIQRNVAIARIGKEAVHEAVLAYAHFNRRHPVKEWLTSMEWDRIPRLDTFFHHYMGAEDNAFTRATSANFFVSMLARVFSPGCQVDNMVVLEGVQGARKSSALRALAGKWFTECNEPISNGNNKDFYAVLQGKMLVEIAELDSFSRADIKRIKAIITTGSDRYRPAYGRIAQTFPRTSVFVGTTNEDEYLEDATGGRRFWPIRVENIRLEEIQKDRSQIFAEALHRYRAKAVWWEMPKAQTEAEQEARRKTDPWEPIVENWLALPRMDKPTSQLIMGEALKLDPARMDKFAMMRIAYVMKALGYKNKVAKDSGECRRVWVKN